MTDGYDATRDRQPSWEQLLSGAHPAFGLAGARPGRSPRHGRDVVRSDDDLVDRRFAAIVHGLRLGTDGLTDPARDDGGMGWADAASWTAVAAGGTLLLASRLGELLR